EDAGAAQAGDVPGELLGPGGPERVVRVVALAERQQQPLVDRPRLALRHLVGELGEQPHAAGGEQQRHEEAELVRARPGEEPRESVPHEPSQTRANMTDAKRAISKTATATVSTRLRAVSTSTAAVRPWSCSTISASSRACWASRC